MTGIECAFFGALGRDAERKESKSGKIYLRLNIRLGEGDSTQWVNVNTFDQDAIDKADRLVKGARVYIEGRLTLDEWTGADGKERHGLSVMSFHCRLSEIGRNKTARKPERDAAPAGGGGRACDLDDDIPF